MPDSFANVIIPWGTSTCSKAPQFLPEEPTKIISGKGCRVTSEDGREFIDFRNGLGPVTLGYAYPQVNAAIAEQLEKGVCYGHAHPLEEEVARGLSERVPCAERVRFLKTGGEAMAACIRLARHATGRKHTLQIGYNGWINTLADNAMRLPSSPGDCATVPGVPREIASLYHACPWNDTAFITQLVEELSGDVASIAVAADYVDLAEGETFYPWLRAFTEKHGIVLILDEIVTGFRVAHGGVQEKFGILADLAVYSKGIANGMPISAYMGKAEIMDKLDTLIVTSTFGGEALSLAACKATLEIYRNEDVIGHLWKQGRRLWREFNRLCEERGVEIRARGYEVCPRFCFESAKPGKLAEHFFRAAYKQGISLYHVSYVNYSHKDSDITETLERLKEALKSL